MQHLPVGSAAGAPRPRTKRGEGEREGGMDAAAAGPGGSEREMKGLGRTEREQSTLTRGGKLLPWGQDLFEGVTPTTPALEGQ